MTTRLSGVKGIEGLFLDFDGPVCRVFAGLPDHVAADRLRAVLAGAGAPVPEDLAHVRDPLEVLRFCGQHHSELLPDVEAEMQRTEREAVHTAALTPGISKVLEHAPAGRIVVVSNNSAAAIRQFFELHPQLFDHLSALAIVGRNASDPSLMKPNPHPLFEAIRLSHAPATSCVLVGDSISDVEAGNAAGIRVIGYANKPGKSRALREAGAVRVIAAMSELANLLRDLGGNAVAH